MATTYLQLTNELLRELNEVVLTSSNFSDAIGIQAHAKDCINRAYNDIVMSEPQWGFLASGESGATDPFYGNVYVETVAGTRWYELKESSSDVTTDYGSVDWDNFYLTTIGVSGESAPHTSQNLKFLNSTDWVRYRREEENADDSDSQSYGAPTHVIKSPDTRKFGLSPIPDKVYRVWLFAWDLPTALSAHGDTLVFPDLYATVLMSRARYHFHQFKDSPQQAAFALQDYKEGLKKMRSNFLNPEPTYMTDDRLYF